MTAMRRNSMLVMSLVAIAWGSGVSSGLAQETLQFSGTESDSTATFEMNGPWLLDWRAMSDTPLAAMVELRLHDGESGRFLGTIAQLQGTGRGLKLFEQSGTYAIAVSASNVLWEIDISPLDKAQAEQLKRRTNLESAMREDVRASSMHLVPDGSFDGWHAETASILILQGNAGPGWRVTFTQPCPGIMAAKTISFVTPAKGTLDAYDSILLEDGTRCRFERVIPTITE
ncbi:MAG: hypothetical protein AAF270_05460 [Pseudomonadota bacterium]